MGYAYSQAGMESRPHVFKLSPSGATEGTRWAMSEEIKVKKKRAPGAGRPKSKLDPNAIYALAKKGCSTLEIARILKTSPDTLRRNFASEMESGRASLCINLRELIIKMAFSGNTSMALEAVNRYLGPKKDIGQAAEDELYSPIDSLIENGG